MMEEIMEEVDEWASDVRLRAGGDVREDPTESDLRLMLDDAQKIVALLERAIAIGRS